MRFQPIGPDEEERMYMSPLPAGEYKLVVTAANDKVSKAGNEMIELILQSEDGHWIYDYLISLESGQWKLRRFCDSAGILDIYETGQITARDCHGRVVEAEVVIEGSEEYGAKNKIRSYIKRTMPEMPAPARDDISDEDIPF